MKSYINKYLLGAVAFAATGLVSCVSDLDQLPKNPTDLTPDQFANNPKEYIGGALGKCYSGIAVSGQGGNGSSDISGLDNGRSCWSRAIFMLNEFTTDECLWIWKDSGVFDLCTSTWSSNNENVFGTYSRLYTHIAVCNDFIRLSRNLGDYGISTGDGENQVTQAELDQFVLEARALRDLSYFYVIDLFGNAAYAWDTQLTGEEPPYITRTELFNTVTDDLEDVLANFKESGVYGRIGKDAVQALLAKFYLNAEVWTGTARWQECWNHCQEIINRHKGGGFEGSGLAMDYLSVFCGNNDMFAPGGSLTAQNEILWNIPYAYQGTITTTDGSQQTVALTQSYGGTAFLILSALSDQTTATSGWFGINGQWTCMHARPEFSEKFNFSNGVSQDNRTWLWFTENDGFTMANTDFSTYKNGYVPNKFTNVNCNPDGTMPRWEDPETGLPRVGVHDLNNPDNYGIDASATFPNTDYPVIRLAEIYLTAAEAYVRGNVGNQSDALDYVNVIRRRAGVGNWNAAELTANNLLDERARELYWENNRRTDLVRAGVFTSRYNWSWKNNVESGAAISDHMNIFPIPSSVINSYASEYPQNPGY
ncbi:MAG: RagB/SusD family nutrient uptake outer membrane protein [Bacteroides sp.]|nr:RagB/SusD family nutrient uptake outer membrane protein [Bacteroides sp.]